MPRAAIKRLLRTELQEDLGIFLSEERINKTIHHLSGDQITGGSGKIENRQKV